MESGAPLDLVFQSIAGTEAANRSFGINLALLKEARDAALSLHRETVGDNSCTLRPAREVAFPPSASRRRSTDT